MRGTGPLLAAALVVTAVASAGCSDGGAAGDGERTDPPTDSSGAVGAITVTSTAFDEGQPIPVLYSCDGAAVSPPLAWSGVPSDAETLALVVDDPDAPGGTYIHWAVVNIDPGATQVGEDSLPAGGTPLINSSGYTKFVGPCPPSGTHHYRFTVYALDGRVEVTPDGSLDDAFDAIQSEGTAEGTLTGTFNHDRGTM
jgi:Raf kinase inhibitor-like YbhB/YbcL family protein